MKKIAIPAILAATVLVAGMFAVMPVQKASTVHTTILSQIATAFFGTTTMPTSKTRVVDTASQGFNGTGAQLSTAFFGAATIPSTLTAPAGATIVSKYVTTAVTTATTVIFLGSSAPWKATVVLYSSGGTAASVFTVTRNAGATLTAGTVTSGVVTTAGATTGGTASTLGTMSLTAPTQFVVTVSGGASDSVVIAITTLGLSASVTAEAVYNGSPGATFI